MRLQTSFRDQHPSWVPTTGKASLFTTNQSCLSQVLVKLAPLFKEENLRISERAIAPEPWNAELDQKSGEKPEPLFQHCPFSGDLVSLARTQWDAVWRSCVNCPVWLVYPTERKPCHRHHTSCSATASYLVVVRCSVFTFLGLPLFLNVSLWAAVFINHPTHLGANWILGQNPGFFPQRAGRPKEVYFESFFLRENLVLTPFL